MDKSAQKAPPLKGLRVLDFTEHMAGPLCTMVLADMGAEVIKVERPGKGDSSRMMGDGDERNPYFRYINRNKKSLCLNFKSEQGHALVLKLIKTCDILVENYRATVMKRAQLDYHSLKSTHPRLIYASLSGFGADGPYQEKGGFDLIAQGMGGIMQVTGEAGAPPTSVGLPICDMGTGMWALSGILAALYQRTQTGIGQWIDCSLLETAIGYSSWTSAAWLVDQKEPERLGSKHRQNAPYQRITTKDGYMMVGAADQPLWERFADSLGQSQWKTDARFGTPAARRQHRHALEQAITKVMEAQTTAHWVSVLDEAGVPSGPVNNYEQLFNDPQVKHRKMIETLHDDVLGEVPHIRTPIRMSEADIRVRSIAPKLGEHTGAILTELGVSETQLQMLKSSGVC